MEFHLINMSVLDRKLRCTLWAAAVIRVPVSVFQLILLIYLILADLINSSVFFSTTQETKSKTVAIARFGGSLTSFLS